MSFYDFFMQVFALLTAGIILVILVWYLARPFVLQCFRPPAPPVKNYNTVLFPLQLQACERLIVFADRINPVNSLLRLHYKGISVQELQSQALNEIRQEFQHNITQQLYIDKDVWRMICKLKDDTIAIINTAVQSLPADAAGVELSKTVLQRMVLVADNPYDIAIDLIKSDIQKRLQHG